MQLKNVVYLSRKATIIVIRFVVFLLMLVFVVYGPSRTVRYSGPLFAMLWLYVVSELALLMLHQKFLARFWFQTTLFIFDVSILSLIIYFSQGFNQDLYLVYLLTIFMAGFGRNDKQVLLVASVATIFYSAILFKGMEASAFEPFALLRIPFIFIAALLSNYYIIQIQQKEDEMDSLERDTRMRLERANRALAAMYKTSVIIPTLSIHEVLNIIVDNACEALECEIASILLQDDRTGELRILAARGLDEDLVRSTYVKSGERITGWVFQHRSSLLVDDIEKDGRFRLRSDPKYYTASLISAPLKVDDRIIGVINVNNKRNREKFSEDDLKLLESLASESAVAIQNARLFFSLQQERDKLITIFNGMSDGAVVTDEKFGILMVNHAAEVFLNIKERDVLGQHLLAFMHGFECSVDLHELRESTDWVTQFELERRAGKYFALHVTLTRIFNNDGTVAAQIALFRDVTHDNQENQSKKSFIAAISHRLRGPMTTITWCINQIIQSGTLMAFADEQQRKALQSIQQEAQVLSELLDKLLRFNLLQTESLILKREKVLVRYLLDFAARGMDPQLRAARVKLTVGTEVSTLPPVHVDPVKVQEVFSNLLENAVKSMDKPEPVIEVHGLVRGRFVQVSFRDNGRGVPPEDRERVFQKFYRLEETVQRQDSDSSVGLGLAMSRQVVEAHGGRIWLESELGIGSVFNITLPLWQEEQYTKP